MEPEDPPAGRAPTRVGRKDRVASTPVRLTDLDPAARRRPSSVAAQRSCSSWVFVVGAFYLLPIGHESGFRAVPTPGSRHSARRRRLRLADPTDLAGRASGTPSRRGPGHRGRGLPRLVLRHLPGDVARFAAATFTTSLDHTRALYFTVSIFSTVGFGDITPKTDTARLVVSAQMLLDFVIIGAAVRIIFNAARSRVTPGATAAAGEGH